jgi:hypothetical protein
MYCSQPSSRSTDFMSKRFPSRQSSDTWLSPEPIIMEVHIQVEV